MSQSLFLSFLIHLLLALLFIQPHIFLKREKSRAIEVLLLQGGDFSDHSERTQGSNKPSPQKSKNKDTDLHKRRPPSELLTQKEIAIHPENSTQKFTENKMTSGKGNGSGSESLSGAPKASHIVSEYATELIAALNQLKEYPPFSKERRETGQVQLSFKLRKNGEITEIKILQPSPYQRLNDAAVNTVQKLKRFKPVPDEVSKGDWNVILPIEFKVS